MQQFHFNMFKRSVLFFSLFVGSFFFAGVSHAFQVSPVRQTIVLDPGSTQIIPLTVINDSDAQQIFTPELSAFGVDSKTGSPIFDQPDEATGWFRVLPERLLLQPGQTGTFSFTVSIPGAAEVKSHYLGLFARAQPTHGQIGVSTRLGSLLFLHISGEAREELVRRTFDSNVFFSRDGRASVQLALENVGTIHVVPDGVVTVRNRSGQTIQTFPLNPDGRKILPGGMFEASYSVEGVGDIGPVHVSVDLGYGATKKELHDTTTFWYVPSALYYAGIALLGMVLLIGLILFGKRYKNKSTNTSKR